MLVDKGFQELVTALELLSKELLTDATRTLADVTVADATLDSSE